MRFLARIALNGIAILLAARFIPGIVWQGDILYLLITGLVVAGINMLVKPVAKLISLPFIILTLGLFLLVVNAAMLKLADLLLDGLTVEGWVAAILGGLLLGLFNWAVELFDKD